MELIAKSDPSRSRKALSYLFIALNLGGLERKRLLLAFNYPCSTNNDVVSDALNVDWRQINWDTACDHRACESDKRHPASKYSD